MYCCYRISTSILPIFRVALFADFLLFLFVFFVFVVVVIFVCLFVVVSFISFLFVFVLLLGRQTSGQTDKQIDR